MTGILDLYFDQILVFVLVLTRLSGLLMTMPVLGSQNIPLKIRAFLAIAMSLVITPLYWGTAIPHPHNLLELTLLLGTELIIGLSLGLSILILTSGLQLAGLIVGQMSGMQLADVADPTFNTSVPVFAQLLNLVALCVFVLIDGHREVMNALLDSFRHMPPGNSPLPTDLMHAVTEVGGMSFSMAIRAAAPVMIALLMSMLVLGLISRTLPQLNVIAVGFSLNSLVMMATLAATIGSAAWIFQEYVEQVLYRFQQLVAAQAG